jgi:hypothetical protein
MGEKKYFDMGSSGGGKTDKAIDALKNYISGISPQEKKKIQRELEREGDSDEESPVGFKTLEFKDVKFLTPQNWSRHTPTYYHTTDGWVSWIPSAAQASFVGGDAPKNEVEEDVQDVNFEE